MGGPLCSDHKGASKNGAVGGHLRASPKGQWGLPFVPCLSIAFLVNGKNVVWWTRNVFDNSTGKIQFVYNRGFKVSFWLSLFNTQKLSFMESYSSIWKRDSNLAIEKAYLILWLCDSSHVFGFHPNLVLVGSLVVDRNSGFIWIPIIDHLDW